MGRSKPPPDQVVPEDVCFHGSDERPNRFLSLSDRLVVTRAHGLAHPQLVDLGDRSAVLLEYRLPLVAWPDFKRWASTSITSLLRVLHLLYQPQWSAWTARDVLSEGPAITRLLSSHRALPFGVAGKRLAGSGGEPLKAPGPINLWRH